MVLLLTAAAAGAQTNYRVVEVEVEGNRVATPSLILGVANVDKGSALTASAVQETIHRLYGLGIFSDVRIKAEEVTGGIKVVIVVKELPKLAGLEFSGNDKIKTGDLKDKLRLGVGGYISPYLIHQKKQDILQAYSEKGYFQARVTPSLDYSSDSSAAVLRFAIDERSKVKVEKVMMTGNVRVEANDLIKKMRNRKRGFLRSSDFAQEKYEEDLQKVADEYHKKGFLDAYVISDSMTIDTATNRMTIFLDVYEGPLYYFGEVKFQGNEELPEKALKSALKYSKWDIFNEEKHEESMIELYSTYQEIGHLHARIFDERTTRNDSIIDITYELSEGLPSHIKLVNIVGNTRTKDWVIRREISSLPGQVFSRALLIRSVRDCMALNYFNTVEPEPIMRPDGDVDLEFKVDEKQTAQISAGAGYNSQDKLVGSVGLGIPNFRGVGQNLSFNIDFGSRRNSYSLSFTEPWMFGRPTLFGTELYSINRKWYDDYTEARQGASIRLGRRLRWPDDYFRVYTSYRLERNRFYDFDEDFIKENSYRTKLYWDSIGDGTNWKTRYKYGEPIPGSVVAYNEAWNTASRWTATITRDSRNLPEFATNGALISYTYSNTGNWLGGYWEYQKHEISVAKFIPIFWKVALAAKVQYGAISAREDSLILLSDRFVPGGTAYDGIVRGYDDGELTPDTSYAVSDTTLWFRGPDADIYNDTPDSVTVSDTSYTTRVRGKYMLVANIELQLPIIERQLYVLAFFDAGNSFLHTADIRWDHLYKSYGFGFRLQIPGMGTLGFDFGKALDNRAGEEKGWKPHFQIGTTFGR